MAQSNREDVFFLEGGDILNVQAVDALSNRLVAPFRCECKEIWLHTNALIDAGGNTFDVLINAVDTLIDVEIPQMGADEGVLINVPPGVVLEAGDSIQIRSNGETATAGPDCFLTYVMSPLTNVYDMPGSFVFGNLSITNIGGIGALTDEHLVPDAGKLIAITAHGEDITGADLILTIFKNGVTTGVTATIPVTLGAEYSHLLALDGVPEFASGDRMHLVGDGGPGGSEDVWFSFIFRRTERVISNREFVLSDVISNLASATATGRGKDLVMPVHGEFGGIRMNCVTDPDATTVLTLEINTVGHATTYTLVAADDDDVLIFKPAGSRFSVTAGSIVTLQSDGGQIGVGKMPYSLVWRA